MLTIIISSVVLLEFGVSGRTGMFFVMAIAGMVCTALSVSGQTITDLKTGLLAGIHARRAGEGQVLRRHLLGDRRGRHDRRAGAELPVRRSRPGRHAAGPRVASGFDHEGARRGVHEPAARRVRALRRRRDDHDRDGDAGGPAADRGPRHVSSARAQHARARRRRDVPLRPEAVGKGGRRGGANDARAGDHHRLGPDGRRGAGRAVRRRAAPLRMVPGGSDQAAVLRQRSGLPDRELHRLHPHQCAISGSGR